jgi:alkanesulfonate monooxygenase SsuD/methylene tetrahydromethanopterin reductase-like flavin-dependent oxidoreductase (luciferase family)
VTPRPDPPPPILLGGGTPAAARRAARIADGWFPPLEPKLWPPYREECLRLGKPDPGAYPPQGPIFLWISEEPEKDWERLLPHALHQLRSYSEWTVEAYGRPMGPYAKEMSAETVRQSPAYRVLAPEQALALAAELGPQGVLYLNPLLAGIEPAFAEAMLGLYERRVHPFLPR